MQQRKGVTAMVVNGSRNAPPIAGIGNNNGGGNGNGNVNVSYTNNNHKETATIIKNGDHPN